MDYMPHDLALLVSERYGLSGETARVAAGVSGSTLWRVESPQPVLVRVSEHFSVQHVERVCDGVTRLARDLDEVVAPMVGVDGSTTFLWNDRPVSVWPFLPGRPLDRHSSREVQGAAQLLARVHKIRPDADRTAPYEDIPGADNAAAAAALLPDPTLDRWLDQWHHQSVGIDGRGWRHGDFFWQNILCHDGAVIGLIDWDDISFGPTDVELALRPRRRSVQV